jgi:hypothetical protein
VRLPPACKEFAKQLVKSMLGKRTCTVKEMQSMVGFLGYASKVVYGGRTFTRRLINTVSDAKLKPHMHITINAYVRADLQWWSDFLDEWEGKAILLDPLPVLAEDFQLDACGNPELGIGAFWEGEWVQEKWDAEIAAFIQEKKLFSFHLEVYPMLVAARAWGKSGPVSMLLFIRTIRRQFRPLILAQLEMI